MGQQLTPDGTCYIWADPKTINDCWISSTDFPNLAKYASDATKSPYLENAIIAACAAINKICNRKFNKQVIDDIYTNEVLAFRDYKVYALKNRPVVSVDKVWLNVTNTFALIDPTYFQLLPSEGVLKILPTFSVYVQTTLPFYAYSTASNLWIRYTSGYEKTDVPQDVKLATAMYVDYYFSRFNLTGGISSFGTQTYNQTNVTKPDSDPILVAINEILKTYKFYTMK